MWYTSECDTLNQFIEENYVKVPFSNTLLKDFTTDYNDWCKLNHYPASNSRTLAAELRSEGYAVDPGAKNSLYIKGLGLKDDNRIC